jgi:hypothetical protein
MQEQTGVNPWRTALALWGVANANNVLHPAGFLPFIALTVVVGCTWPVEFRSPMRYGIVVPYPVLSFGAILLTGRPMFRLNRKLGLATVATMVLLLGTMGVAMRRGAA